MPNFCPACGRALAAVNAGAFCPHCGTPLDPGSAPTATSPSPVAHPVQPRVTRADPGTRFIPGSIVGDRYRMIGLLGRGGMGEVYRADDLKLGLPVALKFLPENVERDQDRLDRFIAEVRMSLRVTHPNVCRVFDVGQIATPDAAGHAQTRHFLSMEFVDGEDLASLLRRIGRLPEDKAVEIARQLCAGLSAAHDEGVLHRDLKPANIMIDGRGRAKIADFGLAGAAGIHGAEARAGTPQYMAPEQVSGGTLTERTDIYALGLVLYEVFTGKRAFEIKDLDDLNRLSSSTPTSPSSHVSGLNPLVERAILRCLDPDPQKRPASASALAAALPGGDPLAMAIAAGDTPSPEMVAAAGSDAGLRPSVAWSLALFTIVGVIVAGILTSRLVSLRVAAPTKPPAVLVEKARELLRALEFQSPTDSAWGVSAAWDYLIHAAAKGQVGPDDTPAVRGSTFWYRHSPVVLERDRFRWKDDIQSVSMVDPAMAFSGEALVILDPTGRLIDFTAMPRQVTKTKTGREVDWTILFRAAGLDHTAWVPAEPQWAPKYFGDRQVAWTPRDPAVISPERIEAASFDGTPVNFLVIYPWTEAGRMVDTQLDRASQIGDIVIGVIIGATFFGSVFLARRNLRLDRADRRGATRLALFVGITTMVIWALDEHHIVATWELTLLIMAASWAVFSALLSAGIYLAFEPYVRRTWPAMLVSWTRLISGSIRDPLVARDVLIGCAAGVATFVISASSHFAARAMTGALSPYWSNPRPLNGAFHAVAEVGNSLIGAIVMSLTFLFVLFLIRRVIRHDLLAAIAAGMLTGLPDALLTNWPIPLAATVLVMRILAFLLLARVGLVAFMTLTFVQFVMPSFPFTLDINAWHFAVGLGGVLAVSALAIASMRVAMAGNAAKSSSS